MEQLKLNGKIHIVYISKVYNTNPAIWNLVTLTLGCYLETQNSISVDEIHTEHVTADYLVLSFYILKATTLQTSNR